MVCSVGLKIAKREELAGNSKNISDIILMHNELDALLPVGFFILNSF